MAAATRSAKSWSACTGPRIATYLSYSGRARPGFHGQPPEPAIEVRPTLLVHSAHEPVVYDDAVVYLRIRAMPPNIQFMGLGCDPCARPALHDGTSGDLAIWRGYHFPATTVLTRLNPCGPPWVSFSRHCSRFRQGVGSWIRRGVAGKKRIGYSTCGVMLCGTSFSLAFRSLLVIRRVVFGGERCRRVDGAVASGTVVFASGGLSSGPS